MRWREGWRWWWRLWRRVRTHENMQHVSQDVCFKMDPGTSQSLSLLLLCWRCPLQHHTSAHARTCTRTHARTHTCTRTHVHECIHAGLIQREEKNHKNVLLGHQASPRRVCRPAIYPSISPQCYQVMMTTLALLCLRLAGSHSHRKQAHFQHLLSHFLIFRRGAMERDLFTKPVN